MPAVLRILMMGSLLVGCSDPGEPTVCELEGMGCDDCFTSNHECEYEGVVVVEPSCNGCQARFELYRELCERGNTDTLQEVDAGMVCSDVE